jgi:YHS domain-containing protein
MDVKPEQAKAKSEHHGQTYHFCSNECKQKFDKSPDSFTQKGGHQPQGGQQAHQPHGGQQPHGTHQPQTGQRPQQQGGGQQQPGHHQKP